MSFPSYYREHISIVARLRDIPWGFVALICVLAVIGFAALYSAAGGRFEPWAARQMARFGFGIVVLLAVAMVDLRIWLKYAYVVYGVALILLLAVEGMGLISAGAQRWINLGVLRLQPSEVMKVALVLALARYFHKAPHEDVGRVWRLIPPLAMMGLPMALVLRQPDLGTAALLGFAGSVMLFAAGVQIWKFAAVGAVGLAAVPFAWGFLHDYQKKRVLTFLDPESDPLGSGYHIIQSKIALGSGGVWGKGYLQGSQSHLSFIPETQTDFVFSMFAEEFGLVGGVVLVALFATVIFYGMVIAMRSRNQFGRMLAFGVSTTLFLYVFMNVAMVTGLIPVVGVPLPLISYGGTAMLSLMFGFGLILSVYISRDARIGRFDDED